MLNKNQIKKEVLETMKNKLTASGEPEDCYDWEQSEKSMCSEVIDEVLKRVM